VPELIDLQPGRAIMVKNVSTYMEDVIMPDNWGDRKKLMVCGRCMFFVPKGKGPVVGRCRKHAPTCEGWPVMFRTDFCGDFKLDEEKV